MTAREGRVVEEGEDCRLDVESNRIILSFSFGAGDAFSWLFPGRLISCWNIFLVFGDGSLYQV